MPRRRNSGAVPGSANSASFGSLRETQITEVPAILPSTRATYSSLRSSALTALESSSRTHEMSSPTPTSSGTVSHIAQISSIISIETGTSYRVISASTGVPPFPSRVWRGQGWQRPESITATGTIPTRYTVIRNGREQTAARRRLEYENQKTHTNRRRHKMSARLTVTIALLAGALMLFAIACDSAPASTAPTPADPTATVAAPVTADPTATATAPPAAEPTAIAPEVPTAVSGNPEMLSAAQAELDRNRALWDTSRADDYSYVLAPICFCPPDVLEPVRISVLGRVVATVAYEESGKAPEHDGYGRYVTIDDLFDTIQEAIDGKAADVAVTYDPEVGYPTDASLDYDTRMADEEYRFTASGYSAGGTSEEPEVSKAPAPIETVEVTYVGSAGYGLAIVSGLPSGCAKFGGYEPELRGKVIEVTVSNLVPTGPVGCTAIYSLHGGQVDLGHDLEVGATYTVVTNGRVTNSFVVRDPKWFLAPVVESPIRIFEIDVLESSPPQYQVSVVSTLPLGSSCSRFNGYDVVRRVGNEIHVTVTHLEVLEKNLPCTRDLPAVDTLIPLGSDFTSGVEYTVVLNGDRKTFTAQ